MKFNITPCRCGSEDLETIETEGEVTIRCRKCGNTVSMSIANSLNSYLISELLVVFKNMKVARAIDKWNEANKK